MNLQISFVDKLVNSETTTTLISKTDRFGTIKYFNENFVKISKYKEFELVGNSHNIIRHPDMPKVIFKLLWDNISKGQNFDTVIKNMSKSGQCYWVYMQIESVINENGDILGYTSKETKISDNKASVFEKVYERLKKIEEQLDVITAEKFLYGYLTEQKKTYSEFIKEQF